MPRAPGIPDFTAKLALVLDRLCWSRGQLAQKAGVDKSVALRWAAGHVTPGEASLVSLTAAIRAELPGFARADWQLPTAQFGERLIAAAQPPGGPVLAQAARTLYPRAMAAGGGAPVELASRYTGCWLLLQAGGTADRPEVTGSLARIAPRDGMLWMETESGPGGTWRAAGPVFPQHRLLQTTLEEENGALAFGLLWGAAEGRAMVLDGLAAATASALRGPAVAARLIALRLEEAETALPAATARLDRLNATGLLHSLPPVLASRFRQPEASRPAPMALSLPAADSLACDEAELTAGLLPESAAALQAARSLLGLRVAA